MDAGLSHLNTLSESEFAAALAGIYEHSSWVAARAAGARPFETLAALHAALETAVTEASAAEQVALIRAHPDLAGRAVVAGELTEHSSTEQQGAGLDQLTPDEYARFHTLNTAYSDRFGFPFVLAVKGHDKTSILVAFEARLGNDPQTERETALQEIHKIARFRLETVLG